jgi:transitional endoplasmic reticulum ATPase
MLAPRRNRALQGALLAAGLAVVCAGPTVPSAGAGALRPARLSLGRRNLVALRGGNAVMTEAKEGDSELVKKISPNRLVWKEPTSKDNSIVGINPTRMEQIGLFNGDTVLLKGRRSRETVCVVVPDATIKEEETRLPKSVKRWLKLGQDDRVKITQFPDIKNAKRVHVLPFKDSVQGFEGDVFEVFLKPYFQDNFRPVHAGEVFPVHNEELDRTVDFKVMQIDEEETEFGVVAPESVVYTEGEPLERDEADPDRGSDVGYDDIGGLSKQVPCASP